MIAKSFPWGGGRQLFYAHSVANPYNVPFCPTFFSFFCIPPPSSAPASRGTFPRGKVLAVTFRGYHSTGAVPKALREREDDILPYGGWEILTGTIQPVPYRKRCANGRMISSPTVGGRFWLAPFNRGRTESASRSGGCYPPLRWVGDFNRYHSTGYVKMYLSSPQKRYRAG